MTQNEKVLAYIQKHGSITPREAFNEFDIMRLASRISDLKKLGHPITSVTETRTNSYGEKKSYARYFYGRV